MLSVKFVIILPCLKRLFVMQIGNLVFSEIPVFLAPMEDVTDSSFRLICREFGADAVYTEFISSEGLIRNAGKSIGKLSFEEAERPVAIQIFGNNPESMKIAAQAAAEVKPDIIDINFGCSVRKVVSKGCGAALMREPDKMESICKAVVDAVDIPVTVKTRLGWDDKNKNVVEITKRLQDTGIAAITIHGRTKSQMFSGDADWTLIGEVKNNPGIKIPVIGNGDIKTPYDAKEKIDKYGVDGIMIGRAAIGNPWIFRDVKLYLDKGEMPQPVLVAERVRVCSMHFEESLALKGHRRGLLEMRKHYSPYFKGVKDFKKYKILLLTADNEKEIREIFDKILNYFT